MQVSIVELLHVGGKSDSLGRAPEVVELVLQDKRRLKELYGCLFDDDSWVRMRAADSLEKICRVHPEWLEPYVDRLQSDFASSDQPSIQWHLAQIYRQVSLTNAQKSEVIKWLCQLLSTTEVDWIVAANVIDTLGQFVRDGSVSEDTFRKLLNVQQAHHSKAVVKRADKWLDQI